uniref:Uncharacterized protein n=1 Tax=Ciona savignyi TaxID=51511 RepID=H2YY99_CIOSA
MDPADTDVTLESNRIKPEPASSNWKPATSLKESIPPANKQIRNNEPLDNIKQSTRKHSREEQLFSSRKIEWKEVSSDAYSAMQNAAGLKDNLK